MRCTSGRGLSTIVAVLLATGIGAAGAAIVEPTVSGKIVDAATQAPIDGALVFGYYATVAGTVGGGHSPAEQLRSFAVSTNDAGRFTVPGWQMTRTPDGIRRDRFPVVAVFKSGYRTDLRGLQSIAHWQASSLSAANAPGSASASDTLDWSATPLALTPVTTELERYQMLRAASVGVSMMGECGWEIYAPVLRALHDELLGIIRRTVPDADRDEQGYLRSGRPHPMPFVDFLTRSAVDRLLQQFKQHPAAWKCANPAQVFEGLRP